MPCMKRRNMRALLPSTLATQQELLLAIDGLIGAGNTVLVKASRGMQLEQTVAHITQKAK